MLLSMLLMGTPAMVKKASGMININTASVQRLDMLPGIGPAMAERIIKFREKNGKFKVKSDLMLVRGIGEKKYKKLQDLILVKRSEKKKE